MYIVGAILTTIIGCWLFGLAFEPGYVASLIMGSFILYAILYKQKK
jgi:hypothetical protein